ncbi:MAG: hypothetical protein CM15mP92_0690 [Halieaceae bacterium]|nr:MAG: hypothetical protein CM15mP92_0690 [Halieaceae bacterium]
MFVYVATILVVYWLIDLRREKSVMLVDYYCVSDIVFLLLNT